MGGFDLGLWARIARLALVALACITPAALSAQSVVSLSEGEGVHGGQLIVPVNMKGWLLILPYALLVPLLLVRDQAQLRRLR